jgi:hypothetical protein
MALKRALQWNFHGHILQNLEALYHKYRKNSIKNTIAKRVMILHEILLFDWWVLPMDYFLIINGVVDLTHWETKPPPSNLKRGMYVYGGKTSTCWIIMSGCAHLKVGWRSDLPFENWFFGEVNTTISCTFWKDCQVRNHLCTLDKVGVF